MIDDNRDDRSFIRDDEVEESRREQQEGDQSNSKEIVDRAYEEFFKSNAGQVIWADLCVQYNPHMPSTIADGHLDVNATLVSLGQHNVLKYIINQSTQHDYSHSIKQRQEQIDVRNRANNIGG